MTLKRWREISSMSHQQITLWSPRLIKIDSSSIMLARASKATWRRRMCSEKPRIEMGLVTTRDYKALASQLSCPRRTQIFLMSLSGSSRRIQLRDWARWRMLCNKSIRARYISCVRTHRTSTSWISRWSASSRRLSIRKFQCKLSRFKWWTVTYM